MSPRYVLKLVGQLPDESAFAASVRGGPEHRAWTVQTRVLAAQVNLLHAANQQRAGKKLVKPLVIPPEAKKPKRVIRVADVIARRRSKEVAE